jgi:hypothetical protein
MRGQNLTSGLIQVDTEAAVYAGMAAIYRRERPIGSMFLLFLFFGWPFKHQEWSYIAWIGVCRRKENWNLLCTLKVDIFVEGVLPLRRRLMAN